MFGTSGGGRVEIIMCLAVPARILELKEGMAHVDVLGNKQSARLSLVEGVAVGDFVLLHAGFAIQKLSPEEAQETIALFAEYEAACNENTNAHD